MSNVAVYWKYEGNLLTTLREHTKSVIHGVMCQTLQESIVQ